MSNVANRPMHSLKCGLRLPRAISPVKRAYRHLALGFAGVIVAGAFHPSGKLPPQRLNSLRTPGPRWDPGLPQAGMLRADGAWVVDPTHVDDEAVVLDGAPGQAYLRGDLGLKPKATSPFPFGVLWHGDPRLKPRATSRALKRSRGAFAPRNCQSRSFPFGCAQDDDRALAVCSTPFMTTMRLHPAKPHVSESRRGAPMFVVVRVKQILRFAQDDNQRQRQQQRQRQRQ
jgi:hypothetical protein